MGQLVRFGSRPAGAGRRGDAAPDAAAVSKTLEQRFELGYWLADSMRLSRE